MRTFSVLSSLLLLLKYSMVAKVSFVPVLFDIWFCEMT